MASRSVASRSSRRCGNVPRGLARPRVLRMAVSLEGELRFLPLSEVLYCQREGGHTLVVTAGKTYRIRGAVRAVERRLAPFGFFLAHRGVLVNLNQVHGMHVYSRNSYRVVVGPARTELALSKYRVRALQQAMCV